MQSTSVTALDRMVIDLIYKEFQGFIDGCDDFVSFVDADRVYRAISPAYLDRLGKTRGDVIGRTVESVLGREVYEQIQPYLDRALAGEHVRYQYWFEMRGIGSRLLDVSYAPYRNSEGVVGVTVWARDITDLALAEQSLRASEQRFRDLAEMGADCFWEIDDKLRFVYLSERFEQVTGLVPMELIGLPFTTLCGRGYNHDPKWKRYIRTMKEQQPLDAFEFGWERPDGVRKVLEVISKPVYGDNGILIGYRGVVRDVTEARRTSDRLEYQAKHDALTGLINRHYFERRLGAALVRARQSGAHHALCFFDLDQFKRINDTAGHVAGDALLRQLAEVLRARIRSNDTFSRLGGDEFCLLLEHCPVEKAVEVAGKLIDAVRDYQFEWGGHVFRIGVSAGVVPITPDSASSALLLAQADQACYAAKSRGSNQVQVYDSAVDAV